MRNWTTRHPADIVGCPIVHLGIEGVGPFRALAFAQNQDPRGELCHLLEVTNVQNIRVSND